MGLICVYHKDCNDGFVSAYLVWEQAPTATFYPAQYNKTPIPKATKDDTVLIVDFSFGPEDMKALCEKAYRVIVLDHHASAIKKIDHLKINNLNMVLDVRKSGALLTWEYLYPDRKTNPPPMVTFTSDYDLWEFKHDKTKAFVRFLFFLGFDFLLYQRYGIKAEKEAIDEAIDVGTLLLKDDSIKIDHHLKNSWELLIGEHSFPIGVVNVPRYLTSEVCNELAKDYWFVIGYNDTADGRVLRFNAEKDNDMDVSKLAEDFGGGGHKKSAGAVINKDIPWEQVRQKLSNHIDKLP